VVDAARAARRPAAARGTAASDGADGPSRPREEEPMTTTSPRRRAVAGRPPGAPARRTRGAIPFLTRKLAPFEVLDEEGLSLIEQNADTILQEVGSSSAATPTRSHAARGRADVQGVRFGSPAACAARSSRRRRRGSSPNTPATPSAEVEIGGMHTVFRTELRLAVRARPGPRPPLRTLEDFPQPRQLDLASPAPPPLGRHVCEPSISRSTNGTDRQCLFAPALQRQMPFMARSTAPERRATRSRWPAIAFWARLLPPRGPHGSTSGLIIATRRSSGTSVMLGRRGPTPRRTRRRCSRRSSWPARWPR
jgi:trimethylamine--corrinoid protein Co-methyltransferase